MRTVISSCLAAADFDPAVWVPAAAVGLLVGILLHLFLSRRAVGQARASSQGEIATAREAAARVVDAKVREVAAERTQWDAQFAREKREIEDGLVGLTGVLDDRARDLERRETDLAARTEAIEASKRELRRLKIERRRRERDLRRTFVEQKTALIERAGMTHESAREMILGMIERDVEREQRARFARRLEELGDDLDKAARRLVAIAIGRCNILHEDNGFSGSLVLPSPAFKERLVGRDGANQAAFEEKTGVHLVFDENEPLNLVLSAYDGMKKAIARRAIEKLISQNSAIQPGKIQEFVDKSAREMNRLVLEAGRKVCGTMKIKGVHPELLTLLGRLDYRTSYGQNVLKHSKEVAFLASTIAAEIGIDTLLTKRGALLHDIGKAVDAEIEGGHPEIGAEIATRCKEAQEVIDAIGLHHEDSDKIGLFPLLTQSGDAISGSRPGARRETLERYLKHLEDLETIGQCAEGVETAFAIQAGRELRVFVDPKRVSDDIAAELCRGIRDRVEEELTYPGKIKITVVRESKTSAFAR